MVDLYQLHKSTSDEVLLETILGQIFEVKAKTCLPIMKGRYRYGLLANLARVG
jgi:hypothetical protein